MIWKSFVTFAAVAALFTTAFTGLARGADPGMQPPAGEADSPDPDKAFAAVVISHSRLQREISELAAQKATNPQVKQLAQDVATDHQKLGERVQKAAEKNGITVHPDRLLPRDQAVLDYMKQVPADTLERNYVFYEAGAMQTNALFCQWAAKNAQKPEIKQLAEEITGKVQQRAQAFQQLAQREISGG